MKPRREMAWGAFKGRIYRDFRLKQPQRILTACDGIRQNALPIIEYRLSQPHWWHISIDAMCKSGNIACDLEPAETCHLKPPNLVGFLALQGSRIGVVQIVSRWCTTELAEIKSVDETFSLRLERLDVISNETGVRIVEKRIGLVAEIVRSDFSNTEIWQSHGGFGRLDRGQFSGNLDDPDAPPNLRASVAALIALYFQLIEPLFNTNWGSG